MSLHSGKTLSTKPETISENEHPGQEGVSIGDL